MHDRNENAAFDGTNIGGCLVRVCAEAESQRDDHITVDGDRQERFLVAELLKAGEANAIPARTLARIAGIGTTRQLRDAVSAERSRGIPILSSPRGYFLPAHGRDGVQEVRRFVQTQEAHARSVFQALKAARALLAVVPGQEQLGDF